MRAVAAVVVYLQPMVGILLLVLAELAAAVTEVKMSLALMALPTQVVAEEEVVVAEVLPAAPAAAVLSLSRLTKQGEA